MDAADGKKGAPLPLRRVRMLFTVLLLWGAAAAARAWYIAVPGRQHFIAVGEKMARSTVVIPALRGRILDADGVPLVWSEHFYDLESTVPVSEMHPRDEAALRGVLPDIDPDGKVLRRGLTARELVALEPLVRGGIGGRVVRREERIVIDSPAVRARAGTVRREIGFSRGVSGWELEFDAELAGRPGRLTVLLDRHRNWIPSSAKFLVPMVPGRDVRLKRRLSELEAAREGGDRP